ncbi:MAG: hypothetical protein QOF68_1258 [Gaiellales bacterium]|jgi:hypothetical protein|nr:hypothetical protein [Gaiellales bacterium]
MNRFITKRQLRLLANAVAVALTGALAIAATPASAAKVEGVHMVVTQSPSNSQQVKLAPPAYCPPNERVIGGGGAVVSGSLKPTLTGLRPVRLYDGTRDAYVVTAAETAPGTTANWQVNAYAMCAKPLPGLHIVQSPPIPASSTAAQATAAVCPGGERVIGTGARISTISGDVVLHVARSSGPGDIARAQAHEDADGYSGTWSVTAYAVCAPPPDGYEVVFDPSPLRDSEPIKVAGALRQEGCTGGRQLLSSGAAITNVAPGNVSLYVILPWVDFQQTYAVAVEHTPTSVDWDFIVATSICAS